MRVCVPRFAILTDINRYESLPRLCTEIMSWLCTKAQSDCITGKIVSSQFIVYNRQEKTELTLSPCEQWSLRSSTDQIKFSLFTPCVRIHEIIIVHSKDFDWTAGMCRHACSPIRSLHCLYLVQGPFSNDTDYMYCFFLYSYKEQEKLQYVTNAPEGHL